MVTKRAVSNAARPIAARGTASRLARRAALLPLALAALMGAGAVQAQGTYPTKPIRFMVGFPPGGSADVASRTIAQRLSERLGQPLVMDNRAGAGGMVGLEAIAKSAPDGYTIGIGTSGALTVNPTLRPKMPYDSLKDFAPVSTLVINPIALTIAPGQPPQNTREFLAWAKSQPGKLSFGTAGTGTAMHLAGEVLNQMAGINIVHVPYKGSAPAAVDLMGGQIPLGVLDLAAGLTHIRSGKIRALGMTTLNRSPVAPEIPTLAESGVPGFDVKSWFGIVAPAGTPPEIINRLNAEIVAILNSQEGKDRLVAAGLEALPSTPQAFMDTIRSEIPRWAGVIKAAGIKLE